MGVLGNTGACVITKGYEVEARGVKTGTRSAREPEPVDIPAAYALMNGVWYMVQQGVRGCWSAPGPGSRWCTWCASRAPGTTES